MKRNHIYPVIIIIFLIVICLAAFSRIAGNDFINFDDQKYVTDNDHIQQGINSQTIKWALTATYFSYWHPLTWLSHALDWSLFGANASGHHLVSLLLHIGAVIFLFLFLNKTTNDIWPSAFAAAFFALHPLRVESVAWVSERKDVLSMFFAAACLWAYGFYAEKNKISQYFLCLILFILALMSKPTMIILPFVLMLLDYWPLNRWQKAWDGQGKDIHPVRRLILEKVPFICIAIAASILTFLAQDKQGTVASAETISFISRISNAILSYVSYLGKTIWPFNLAVFYPYELPTPVGKVLLSAIILIFITLAALYYIKKLPFLFAGWFIYLGTLVPVIGLVQAGPQAMADRYTYIPSIGIACILAWGILYLFKDENIHKKLLFPAGITMIIFLSVLTWRQCGYWKDSITLFNHALNVTGDNVLVNNQLGLAYFEKNKNEKALYHYNKAIMLQPAFDDAYNNRGAVYFKLGRYQQALNDFNKTIDLNPSYTQAYNNRANISAQSGQYTSAIDDLSKAIHIDPTYVIAYFNRGLLFTKLGYYQKAIDDFNKVIRFKPNEINSYSNRAFIYFKQGNNVPGCQDANKICELGNCSILEHAKQNGLCR